MNTLLKSIQRRTPLGWLQLRHDRGRLLVALAGIAFADVLMFMQIGFQEALYDSNTRVDRAMVGDIVLVSPKALNLQSLSTFSRRRLLQSMDIPGVQAANALYISSLSWKNPQTRLTANIQVLGFNPEHAAFNLPEVNQQRDKLKIPNVVLFDRGARGQYAEVMAKVDQGKPVTAEVDRQTLTIGGLYRLGASFGADASLMVSDQTFQRLFPKREAASISLGLIRLKPGANPQQVAAALKAHLPEEIGRAHV